MSKWKTQNGSPVLSNENGQGHKKKYELATINKVIWDYLLFYKITITVEYLLGVMNVEADRESMDLEGSSEWKLDTQVFKKICLARGIPNIDLFGSRVSHQIPQCICYGSWTHSARFGMHSK